MNIKIHLLRTVSAALMLVALLSAPLSGIPAAAQEGPVAPADLEAVQAAPAGSTIGHYDLVAPPGTEEFGNKVLALANGNIVVCDPKYDDGATVDVGAVFLFDGATLTLISTLKGSTANDRVCSTGADVSLGVDLLADNKFVVSSPFWDNGSIADAGAVTWVDGATGLDGTVSASNSLVGSAANDQVGRNGVRLLTTSGNYLVGSPLWDNGAAVDAGAVTWVDGSNGHPLGAAGPGAAVSASNSIVGGASGNEVGRTCAEASSGCLGVTELSDGDYVVSSPHWDLSAEATNAGAVTWANGATGTAAVVGAANSLVGSTKDDAVGEWVEPLPGSGNYVVSSPQWDGALEDVGAVTWCPGDGTCTGAVSTANSLHGSAKDDRVGRAGALPSGNYTVRSANWANPGVGANAGAVTWVDGSNGHPLGEAGPGAAVSATNSLVGGTAGDQVGEYDPVVLSNGNYVVYIPGWDSPGPPAVVNAGAAVWASGTAGVAGLVSAGSALHGTTQDDGLGMSVTELAGNGNYVVRAPNWDKPSPDGAVDAGAATWVDGSNGYPLGEAGPGAAISTSNSLHGTTASDQVGSKVIWPLSNGNYVVFSPLWDAPGPPAVANVGAATWASGVSGLAGAVTTANSLHGTTGGDQVGSNGAGAAFGASQLNNGNYVVTSPLWDLSDTVTDAGAATWVDGANGYPAGDSSPGAAVSTSNSLYGATTGVQVGHGEPPYSSPVVALDDGNYVVSSDLATDLGGAATWGNGASGTTGPLSASNSLVGTFYQLSPVRALPGGQYIVTGMRDANGTGVVAWSARSPGLTGQVAEPDALFGTVDNNTMRTTDKSFSPLLQQLAVGRPKENKVTVMYLAWPLTVTVEGTGSGSIAVTPEQDYWPAGAITSTTTLSARIGKTITLTATADPGSVFAGWSGACTGTGDCVVTADAAKDVTATFNIVYRLYLPLVTKSFTP